MFGSSFGGWMLNAYGAAVLYRLGAFHVSKIIIEATSKRIVRDNTILDHKDDFSMLKAFLESQEIDGKYRSELLKEAKIIMGDA